MIVPHGRLIVWFAIVGLPLSALATGLPDAAEVWLGALGILIALALLDATLSRRTLSEVRLVLPESVRLSLDRPGTLEARLHNGSGAGLELRLGLALPAQIRAASDDLVTRLPAGEGPYRLQWSITPAKRGRFLLKDCRLEAASRIGLWVIRKTVPAVVELHVYPNFLDERRRVAALFLRHGAYGTQPMRQVGKGREFEQLRAYQPGDSYEDIHWKATAKRGRPVTKVFQIERTQEVYVALDASRLSARAAGADGVSALDRYINAALLLALAAQRQGDLYGLLTFSDRISRFVRARAGKRHFQACREALATVESEAVTPDFAEIASFIRQRLRRRALLVFLTDLEDPVLAEGFVKSLELIGRHHLVEVLMLRPPDAEELFSEHDVNTEDDVYARLAGHIAFHRLLQLSRILRHRGAHLSLVGSARLTAEIVSRYVAVKRRQIL